MTKNDVTCELKCLVSEEINLRKIIFLRHVLRIEWTYTTRCSIKMRWLKRKRNILHKMLNWKNKYNPKLFKLLIWKRPNKKILRAQVHNVYVRVCIYTIVCIYVHIYFFFFMFSSLFSCPFFSPIHAGMCVCMCGVCAYTHTIHTHHDIL